MDRYLDDFELSAQSRASGQASEQVGSARGDGCAAITRNEVRVKEVNKASSKWRCACVCVGGGGAKESKKLRLADIRQRVLESA